MKRLLLVSLGAIYFILMLGCTSMDRSTSTDKEYYSSINQFTDRSEYYSGFMNVFQMQGTVLNSKILKGQVEKKAQSFNWAEDQKNQELAKVDTSLRTETVVFLSFFSPENKVNNLDSPSTIW